MSVVVLTRPCPICKQPSELDVDQDGLLRWKNGELIQNAFPDLTANQRELLNTGFHPDCWDSVFAETD